MLLQELSRSRLAERMQEMCRLQAQLNRLFDGADRKEFPPVNVWTAENGAMVTAEIPGVVPEDLEISVVENTLSLTGQRAGDSLPEGARSYHQERGIGRFARTLELPFKVDPEKVEATIQKGVLSISLPRSEEDKPRKIAVKSS